MAGSLEPTPDFQTMVPKNGRVPSVVRIMILTAREAVRLLHQVVLGGGFAAEWERDETVRHGSVMPEGIVRHGTDSQEDSEKSEEALHDERRRKR